MDVILNQDDLRLLMEDTNEVIPKWRLLGVQLSVSPARIDTISNEEQDEVHCCQKMLQYWLKTAIHPTRRDLIKALCTKTLDEIGLAAKLEESYQSIASKNGAKISTKKSDKGWKQMTIKATFSPSKVNGTGKFDGDTSFDGSIGTDTTSESGGSEEAYVILRRKKRRNDDSGHNSGQPKLKKKMSRRANYVKLEFEECGRRTAKALTRPIEDHQQVTKDFQTDVTDRLVLLERTVLGDRN